MKISLTDPQNAFQICNTILSIKLEIINSHILGFPTYI